MRRGYENLLRITSEERSDLTSDKKEIRQAGLSFRKDFPIPQVYIDRIIIPEVSKGHSILPQPQWRLLEADIQKPIKKPQ